MTLYLSITIGGVIVTAILTSVSWRHRAAAGGIVLGLLMSFLLFWSSTAALEIFSVSLPAKIFWSKLQYLGIVGTPSFFLLTVFYLARMKSWLRFRRVVWLFPAPAWGGPHSLDNGTFAIRCSSGPL